MSTPLARELALVLGFHGVVERIAHPEIQVNHLDLESFTRVIDMLSERYEIVSLEDVAAAVDGSTRLPANAAALTFDDAYRSVLELADPVLSARGLPYAVFVPTALVDTGRRVPTYVMRAALAFTDSQRVRLPGRLRAFRLRTDDERRRAGAHAARLLRTLPQPRAEEVLAQLRRLLSDDRWAEVDTMLASEALLGWSELAELAGRGVTVGSHTRDHAVLHGGQSLVEVTVQLRESKATIEERLRVPCSHLCFPHGQPRDLCGQAVEAAGLAGYSTAFMSVGGPVREGMNPLLLPRITVAGRPPEAAFAERTLLSHSKWYVEVARELLGE